MMLLTVANEASTAAPPPEPAAETPAPALPPALTTPALPPAPATARLPPLEPAAPGLPPDDVPPELELPGELSELQPARMERAARTAGAASDEDRTFMIENQSSEVRSTIAP